ncbi:unnamed protein product [Brassica oleracea]
MDKFIKLPLTPKKPAFKLHERGQTSKKMEVKINNESCKQKVIAEKGFYVLLSPRSGAEQAPKLLPLFPLPLRSPNATNQWTEEDYRKS